MTEYVEMMDDIIDDEIIELDFKNEIDLINYYYDENVDKQLVYDAISKFNVHQKISDLKDQIMDVAIECFDKFLNDESPTHIFNTGLYENRITKFCDFVYTNSQKGNNLDIVLEIQNEYDDKIEMERLKEEKLEKLRQQHYN